MAVNIKKTAFFLIVTFLLSWTMAFLFFALGDTARSKVAVPAAV